VLDACEASEGGLAAPTSPIYELLEGQKPRTPELRRSPELLTCTPELLKSDLKRSGKVREEARSERGEESSAASAASFTSPPESGRVREESGRVREESERVREKSGRVRESVRVVREDGLATDWRARLAAAAHALPPSAPPARAQPSAEFQTFKSHRPPAASRPAAARSRRVREDEGRHVGARANPGEHLDLEGGFSFADAEVDAASLRLPQGSAWDVRIVTTELYRVSQELSSAHAENARLQGALEALRAEFRMGVREATEGAAASLVMMAAELSQAEARERDTISKAGVARADAESDRLECKRDAEQDRLLFKSALAELQAAVGAALEIPPERLMYFR